MSYYQTEKTFWAKARIGSEEECWEWLRRKDKKGYGVARFMKMTGKDTALPAHRIAYALAKNNGVLPTRSFDVHHICKNKSCVNPNHLELLNHGEHTVKHKLGSGAGCKIHGYDHWYERDRSCKVCRMAQKRERYGWIPQNGCRKHQKIDWNESRHICRICDKERGARKRARQKALKSLNG